MTVYVIGIEPFNEGQLFGIHCNKKTAIKQAEEMEKSKSKLCCQNYVALTETEVKKRKLKLFA